MSCLIRNMLLFFSLGHSTNVSTLIQGGNLFVDAVAVCGIHPWENNFKSFILFWLSLNLKWSKYDLLCD